MENALGGYDRVGCGNLGDPDAFGGFDDFADDRPAMRRPRYRAVRAATRNGRTAVVSAFLMRYKNGRLGHEVIDRLLRSAVAWQHWAIVSLLLQQPALSPHYVLHALKRASAAGEASIALAALADPRLDAALSRPAWEYSSPRTPIVWAVEGGQLEMLQMLLADGRFDPSMGDALPTAADSGRGDIVRCLLSDTRVWHAPQMAGWLREAVPTAARADDAGMLQDLTGHPVLDVAEAVPAALVASATSGAVATLDWLLLRTPDAASGRVRQRALQAAAGGGHLAVVERLLADPMVDASALNNAAVQDAAESGHTAIVARLMGDPRVDASDCGNAALQRALEGEHAACAAELLRDKRMRAKWLRQSLPGAGMTAAGASAGGAAVSTAGAFVAVRTEGLSLEAALERLRHWSKCELVEAASPAPSAQSSLRGVHALLRWPELGLTATEWEEHIVTASQRLDSTDVLLALLNSQFASPGDILRAVSAACAQSIARCAAVLCAMFERPPRCIDPDRSADAGAAAAAGASTLGVPPAIDGGTASAAPSAVGGQGAGRRQALADLLLADAGLSRSCVLALLRAAARLGLTDVVRQTLGHPGLGELGTEGDVAVQHAAREGHVAVLDQLLSDSRVYLGTVRVQHALDSPALDDWEPAPPTGAGWFPGGPHHGPDSDSDSDSSVLEDERAARLDLRCQVASRFLAQPRLVHWEARRNALRAMVKTMRARGFPAWHDGVVLQLASAAWRRRRHAVIAKAVRHRR